MQHRSAITVTVTDEQARQARTRVMIIIIPRSQALRSVGAKLLYVPTRVQLRQPGTAGDETKLTGEELTSKRVERRQDVRPTARDAAAQTVAVCVSDSPRRRSDGREDDGHDDTSRRPSTIRKPFEEPPNSLPIPTSLPPGPNQVHIPVPIPVPFPFPIPSPPHSLPHATCG